MSGKDRRTILLVEDEAMIAMDETAILQRNGFDVISARNAEQAIDMCHESTVDLILMDIDLGRNRMDGTEAAEIILRDHDIPVVFLSSHTEPGIVQKTEKITSYGYVVKNSGETVLLASIKMAFRLFEANRLVVDREETIAREKARLQQYINTAEIMLVAVDRDLRITLVNPKGCEILGYTEVELLGKNWLDHFIVPEEKVYMEEIFSQLFAGNIDDLEYFENPILCSDDNKKIIAWHNSLLMDNEGRITGLLCSGEDITEKKRMDKEIKTVNQMLKNAEQIAKIGSWYIDAGDGYHHWSDNYFDLLGYPRQSVEPSEELFLKKVHPDDRDLVVRKMENSMEKKENAELSFRYINGRGEVRWARSWATFRVYGDEELYRIEGVFQDITEEKRQEEMNRTVEKSYQKLMEKAPYAVFRMSLEDARYEFVSPAIRDVTSYTPRECYENPMLVRETLHPDWIDFFSREWEKLRQGDVPPEYEFQIIDREGKTRWILQHNVLIKDESGKPTHIEGVLSNITDRKNISEKLQESENRRRQAEKLANVGHWDQDLISGELVWSEEVFELFGVDPANFGAIEESFFNLVHPDDRDSIIHLRDRALEEGGDGFTIDHRVVKPDGEVVWVHQIAKIRRDGSGRPVMISGIVQDITERKEKEEEVRKALSEKEYLMKELNHRVKNNLQLISSLINLKSSSLGNNVDLSDINRQIGAIRIVHEKLYRSDDVETIDIRDYFADVAATVFSFSSLHVEVDLSIELGALKTGNAVSLGLIINEMATNAVKYAFGPDNKNPRFSIRFFLDKGNGRQAVLVIANNGKPFPREIDFINSDTLGLRLISALITQLEGSIEIEKEPHPVFTIRIPARVLKV